MTALILSLADIEHQVLQLRCGLLTDGERANPSAVVNDVLALSARLQEAAENFVADLERQRGRAKR